MVYVEGIHEYALELDHALIASLCDAPCLDFESCNAATGIQ